MGGRHVAGSGRDAFGTSRRACSFWAGVADVANAFVPITQQLGRYRVAAVWCEFRRVEAPPTHRDPKVPAFAWAEYIARTHLGCGAQQPDEDGTFEAAGNAAFAIWRGVACSRAISATAPISLDGARKAISVYDFLDQRPAAF